MTPHPQLLDIRHRPDGCVVIKRYPFETVFNREEWEELSNYCASHSSQQSEREKVLDNIMDLVDARIEGLDDLLSTPQEQRTESAQDKYLKEARFELGLVHDEYKELRSKGEQERYIP